MAKSSKKSESKPTGASGAPKKAAAKKSPAKPAAAATGQPMVDTSLSFENAAKLVAAGFSAGAAKNPNAPKQESAMFKQLKAGLNKPHSTTMSNLLDKAHGSEQTKSHSQFKQVGHNQTFGADVTRSGVPRRTPG